MNNDEIWEKIKAQPPAPYWMRLEKLEGEYWTECYAEQSKGEYYDE